MFANSFRSHTMNNNSADVPTVRFASGVESQQKWPMNNESDTVKKASNGPKLVKISPTQGSEGTMITVVVQAFPLKTIAKLAFNSLMVDANQLQAQDITSLVATVPPFQQTHSTTSQVPISICFLEKDMVTETWMVADFYYNDQELEKNKVATQESTTTTLPYIAQNTNGKSSTLTAELHSKNNNDFLNTATVTTNTGYSHFYSSPSGNTPYGVFGSQLPTYHQYYHQQDPGAQQDHNNDRDNFKHRFDQQQQGAQQELYAYNNSTLNNIFNTAGSFSSMLANNGTNALITSSFIPNHKVSPSRTSHRFGLKSASHIPPTSVANYQPYPGLVSRTNLDIIGNLDLMIQNWSPEERQQGRRLVQFYQEQTSNKIKCNFQPVPSSEYVSNTSRIIVSCIYWAERDDFFITSVDCIYLLECLMSLRFSVEEKNRIRRNLEGFRPLTVNKCKPESAEFFKLIMSFPNPKPRNIEKDVKVFPWKILPYALKKIVTKYTASSFSKA